MKIEENLNLIQEKIARSCRKAGRKYEEVKLLAVCKDQPAEKIEQVYACGLRLFGENRVQEAEKHQQELKHLSGICWHFIGKIQKNKINRILSMFKLIETADSVKNLEHISKRVDNTVELFIEINIGEERNKTGFSVDGLKKALNYIGQINRIKIIGLMTVPPVSVDVEARRTYFREMRRLAEEINRLKIPNIAISELSMGMSDDFEIAVEEGSTEVRIGTALFGSRLKQGVDNELFA